MHSRETDKIDPETDDAELLKAAYRLISEPNQLAAVEKLLMQRLCPGADDRSDGVLPARSLASIVPHLLNIADLLDDRGRRRDPDASSAYVLENSSVASILLEANGEVSYANPAATALFDLAAGRPLPPSCLAADQRRELLRCLADMDSRKPGFLAAFQMQSADGAEPLQTYALSVIRHHDGRKLGRLSRLAVPWADTIGRQFGQTLSLTPAELDIAKSVVTGESMSELARRRGRSIGTILQQKKRLLRKLGLGSQTQLAVVFAGFTQLYRSPSETSTHRPPVSDQRKRSFTMTRRGGGTLDYDTVGSSNGKPVLWLHPLLGGTGLSARLHQEVHRRRLRLIMPWRPFYGRTTEEGPLATQVERYTDDLLELLDSLAVPEFNIVAGANASPYGFAVLHRAPERVRQFVGYAATMPMLDLRDILTMRPAAQFPFLLGKTMPSALRFWVRSAMAKIDAGYDQEFILDRYRDMPADQATLRNSELQDLFREGTEHAFMQGVEAISNELQIAVSSWDELVAPLNVPVTLHYGAEDPKLSATFLRNMELRYPHIRVKLHDGCGAHLIHQLPQAVFAEL